MTQVYSRYTGGSSYELFDHELIFFLLLLLMGNLPHDFIINEPCRIVSWLTKLRNIKSSRRTFANLFPCSFLSSCTNHEDHESLIRSYFFFVSLVFLPFATYYNSASHVAGQGQRMTMIIKNRRLFALPLRLTKVKVERGKNERAFERPARGCSRRFIYFFFFFFFFSTGA